MSEKKTNLYTLLTAYLVPLFQFLELLAIPSSVFAPKLAGGRRTAIKGSTLAHSVIDPLHLLFVDILTTNSAEAGKREEQLDVLGELLKVVKTLLTKDAAMRTALVAAVKKGRINRMTGKESMVFKLTGSPAWQNLLRYLESTGATSANRHAWLSHAASRLSGPSMFVRSFGIRSLARNTNFEQFALTFLAGKPDSELNDRAKTAFFDYRTSEGARKAAGAWEVIRTLEDMPLAAKNEPPKKAEQLPEGVSVSVDVLHGGLRVQARLDPLKLVETIKPRLEKPWSTRLQAATQVQTREWRGVPVNELEATLKEASEWLATTVTEAELTALFKEERVARKSKALFDKHISPLSSEDRLLLWELLGTHLEVADITKVQSA